MKKKVLFLMYSMWENRWTEKLYSQLSMELKENYELFFVALFDIQPYDNFFWKYFYLNSNENINKIKYVLNIFKLRKIIKENEINIVIWTNDLLNFFLLLSTLFLNVKKIATIHSNPLLNFNSLIKRFLIKKNYPFFYKVVCVSNMQQKIMIDKFELKNTQTIYNFFDIKKELLKFEEKLDRYEEDIFKNKFNFLMISRLDKLKWFLPILRIFNKLVQKYKHINLIIVWEWNYRENIENFIDENNLNNNIFLLWSKKNIYPYILNSDCFLFPSLSESFWLVLIETLLANKVIISSDCNIWPKEILNPNLNFNQILDYPYYWDYWILIESFNVQDLAKYEKNIQKNLDIKEVVLYDLIEDIYLDKNKYFSKYSNWFKRAIEFDIKNVTQDWIELLW